MLFLWSGLTQIVDGSEKNRCPSAGVISEIVL